MRIKSRAGPEALLAECDFSNQRWLAERTEERPELGRLDLSSADDLLNVVQFIHRNPRLVFSSCTRPS